MTDTSGERYLNRYHRERAARIEAEKLLEEKSDELYGTLIRVKSSQSLLQSAMDSMADGLLLVNQYNEVILANEQLKAIYPDICSIFYDGSNITGKFSQLLQHPEYLLATRAEFKEASFELQLPDERTICVSLRCTREGLLSSTHRDITSVKKNEEERRQLLVDLLKAQRMEAIGRMSGMIAHDFNNIIASIKGYAGFLEEDLEGDQKLQRYANKILAATTKTDELIQRILEYGTEQSKPDENISLIPVLDDCIEMTEATLPKHTRIKFNPPPQPLWIAGRESRFHQLFINLLSNSVKAMNQRSGDIEVTVTHRQSINLKNKPEMITFLDVPVSSCNQAGVLIHDQECVIVSITDSGEGIEIETMERIFEMHFTTRTSGVRGGLGLSSVLDILEDYRGGLRISSLPKKGTCVEVVLPSTESKITTLLQ